jgi:antitoxin MazE
LSFVSTVLHLRELPIALFCEYNVITTSLMRTELIRIGNSRGIRIPKPVIEQCGLEREVDLRVENQCLIISPKHLPRRGWEEQFRRAGVAENDLLLDTSATEFDRTEWHW